MKYGKIYEFKGLVQSNYRQCLRYDKVRKIWESYLIAPDGMEVNHYPMDPEVENIVWAINKVKGITTVHSCSGHGVRETSIMFVVDNEFNFLCWREGLSCHIYDPTIWKSDGGMWDIRVHGPNMGVFWDGHNKNDIRILYELCCTTKDPQTDCDIFAKQCELYVRRMRAGFLQKWVNTREVGWEEFIAANPHFNEFIHKYSAHLQERDGH